MTPPVLRPSTRSEVPDEPARPRPRIPAPDAVSLATDELAAGRMVLLRDDCERAGEGDLLIAAEFADAAAINFMVTEARGLVCLALSHRALRRARPRADRQPRQPVLAGRLGDGLDRGPRGRHHRHLGRRPRPHDRRRGRSGERPRRPRPARPRLPAARPPRRHARAGGADRGGGRAGRGARACAAAASSAS